MAGAEFARRLGSGLNAIKDVWRRSLDDRLARTASSVAFYVVLASIPGIAAVVSVYALISNPGEVTAVSSIFNEMLPPGVANMLNDQIGRIVASRSSGATSVLSSLGWFCVLIWSADRGMNGIVDALNTIYERGEERGFLHRAALILLLTVGAVLLLAVTMFGLFLLPAGIALIGLDDHTSLMLGLLRLPALFLLFGAGLATLYRYGPSRCEVDWRYNLLGSAVGAALWIGFSLAFAWYVPRFGNFNELYGSLGVLIAFMFWLWLSAIAVLIGAEFDATAIRGRKTGPS